jgi:hypothetical protein
MTFSHVFLLRKSLRDSDFFILEPGIIEEIEVSPDLTLSNILIHINALGVQHLRNKDVLLMKVQWFSNPRYFT